MLPSLLRNYSVLTDFLSKFVFNCVCSVFKVFEYIITETGPENNFDIFVQFLLL